METLGQRIADYRKGLGETQEQLAEAMEVSAQAVSKWENDISCPDIALLPQLADHLHISIDVLLRGEEQMAKVRYLPEEGEKKQKILRIRVEEKDGARVNVNLPVELLKEAIRIGLQLPQVTKNEVLKDIDYQSILRMIDMGLEGELVQVEDNNGTNIHIHVE